MSLQKTLLASSCAAARVRTKDPQSLLLKSVDNPRRERDFRTNNGDLDTILFGKADQRRNIVARDLDIFRIFRRPRIPGGDKDSIRAGTLG